MSTINNDGYGADDDNDDNDNDINNATSTSDDGDDVAVAAADDNGSVNNDNNNNNDAVRWIAVRSMWCFAWIRENSSINNLLTASRYAKATDHIRRAHDAPTYKHYADNTVEPPNIKKHRNILTHPS